MRPRPVQRRRGSALILVLLMTLAVAGLAIAAIFLSSSAGLLSRFYDREREFRLAAESALEQVRSRLLMDSVFAIPDTGMVQLLAGHQILDAAGVAIPGVRVNVYAATTGDTTGRWLPHVTLIATSFDPNGTRHVRRMDLRRESFSRYSLFADSSPVAFGPGVVAGRVHTNQRWLFGSAARYRDTVTAGKDVVEGSSVFDAGMVDSVPPVTYPVAGDFALYDSLAAEGNLAFSVVNASGPGWRTGTRLEFVPVDADGDGVLDVDEGFARVFDLQNGMDTTRLTVGLDATDPWGPFGILRATLWHNQVVQNQCGAFYHRNGRWQFFPVATHRAAWARPVIQADAPSFPPVTITTMNNMNDHDFEAAALILQQSTARCFPAGSPYLMTTERFTDGSGVVTGTAADVYPFGTAPSFTWPGLPYGGSDTTFTARSRTCTISVGSTTGLCESGPATLGAWRAFGGGTPLSGVSSTIRQANELPYLWPFAPARNAGSRRVVVATGGPLFVSGEVRGDVLLGVAGAVRIIEKLVYAGDPSDPAAEPCEDQLGLVAAGDILVSDNGLTRGRWIVRGVWDLAYLAKHLGPERDVAVHGALMSLGGTVGVENPDSIVLISRACPLNVSNNTSGGCLRIVGSMVMRRLSALQGSGSSGLRYAGVPDRCQGTTRRPPYFPLTNRYALVRTLEVEPSQANTPARIRAILMRLKGRTL